MFKKFKDKLKSWTKKVSENIEEKEIEVPMKFEVGLQKFEPDVEKIKELEKEIEKEERDEEPKKTSENKKKKEISKNEKEEIKKEKKGFFKKIFKKEKEEAIKEKKEISKEPEKQIEESVEEKESLLKKLKKKATRTTISEKDFDKYSNELEILLLENNVAFVVVEKIIQDLKEKILEKTFEKTSAENIIKESFKEVIKEILLEPFKLVPQIKNKKEGPFVILFCGINGSGKTTTVAKIAKVLLDKNITCVLAASDTFRAASIEQIKEHGKSLGIKVISNNYGSDPASVGFDAIQHAKKNRVKCVLIDTAGRMHTSKNLLKEIEKISRVCNPDLKIFVAESITGNDIVNQAKTFDDSIKIDAIILTKTDIDEKGGAIISAGYITKKPIIFLSTGQKLKDLEKFDKNKFLEKLGL